MRRTLSIFLRDLRRATVRVAWLLAVFLCLVGGESDGAVALWKRDLAVARAATPPWEPVPLDLWVSFARVGPWFGDRSSFQADVHLDGRVTYGDESRLPLPRRVIARLGPAARARLAHLASDPRLRLLAAEPRPCDWMVTCQGGTWLRVTLGESTWTVEHDHGCAGPWSEFLAQIEDEITRLLGVRPVTEGRATLDALPRAGPSEGTLLLMSRSSASQRR